MSGESWNSSHWTSVMLADDVRDNFNDLKSHLSTDGDDIVIQCSDGYINKYDGVFYEASGYRASGFIKIFKDEIYTITTTRNTDHAYSANLVRYNESKERTGYSNDPFNNTDWTAPANGFIRLTNYGTDDPICVHDGINIVVNVNKLSNQISKLNNDISDFNYNINQRVLKNELETAEDLVDLCNATFINRYNHEISPAGGYLTSDYIPVKQNQTYYLTAKHQDGNAYDTSLNLYNTSKIFQSYTTNTYDNTEWVSPIDGYIRISNYGELKPKCITTLIYVTENIDKLKVQVSGLMEDTELQRNLKGKTIIWFGTSIPAGQKTTEVTIDGITVNNNYPEMIGKLLNCTVINQAIGTSCAKTGKPSNISTEDPLGIKGVHYEIATRALSQTLAEKQDFVNNWATKYAPGGSLAPYNAPATLPEYQQNVILNSSYETLLTPYLDGTYDMPDYFVFDHGYNDAAYFTSQTASEMLEIPSNPTDRHYYIGALNMFFQMILSANPKAKILLIDHFCSQDRPWIIDAQKIVSDLWEFPTCELYKISGISMQEITVNNTVKTVKSVYCPDGTHPHSDSTGNTNLMIARKLARWFLSVL